MEKRIGTKWMAAAGLACAFSLAGRAQTDPGGPANARRAGVFSAMQRRVESSGVLVGGAVPGAVFFTLEGKKVSLKDLSDGHPLVLVTASMTCPVSVRTCPYVGDLQVAIPEGVRAAIIYIEEAHPEAGGPTASAMVCKESVPSGHGAYAAPRSLEERLALARLFHRQLKPGVTVYVDGMDNAFQKMIGSGPNSAFLIDSQGVLKVKQGWYSPATLKEAASKHDPGQPPRRSYAIPDTGQSRCYDNAGMIADPRPGDPFFGQDAQYQGPAPAYRDNGDGTVSDLNTGLVWTQDPGEKKSYPQAVAGAAGCRVGGYRDWRLPTIKELYSLIDFDGQDPDPRSSGGTSIRPYIDRSVFKFQYGREEDGDRIIDSQFATSTIYGGTTMGGHKTMFGVNFADGRIKGYAAGATRGGREKRYYALYVRGNPEYGRNRLVDNGDGTVVDEATGLVWQQADSGRGMDWREALAYAGSLELGGHGDWRLPNAKELQSIVDYSRAPDTTGSAAIDPLFFASPILNEAGQGDFPFYWTGTTHLSASGRASAAVYVAFGRAMGCMNGRWMDVHGAGAQRSDPKEGDPAGYPQGRGPQGDAVRIANHVRCVRGGEVSVRASGPVLQGAASPGERPRPPEKRRPQPRPGQPPRQGFGG